MSTRSALLRYSQGFWIGQTTGHFHATLRPFWLEILHTYEWGQFTPTESAALLSDLVSRARGPEFRHFPPFRPFVGPRLQGGSQRAFSGVGQDVEDPRFAPLRLYTRSKPFEVRGIDGAQVRARVGAQLFLSGYLIVELWYRIKASEAVMSGEPLWSIVQGISPNTLGSPVRLTKPGLSGSPREFASGLMASISHSLLTPAGEKLTTSEPWRFVMYAENGPRQAPKSIIGHKLTPLDDFTGQPSNRAHSANPYAGYRRSYDAGDAGSELQAGERGVYYSENPKLPARLIKRRHDTVRLIFDFAHYYGDCLRWANHAARQETAELERASLEGGETRMLTDLGQSVQFAKNLNAFIGALDTAKSSLSGVTSKWQRKLYSIVSDPLDIALQRDKFKKNAGALSRAIARLRGEDLKTRGHVVEDIDVFLSYAREDYAHVARIKERLEGEAGLKVFLDLERIDAAARWTERLSEGVYDAKSVLVCMTQDSLVSRWVREEYALAVKHDKMIPALLGPVSDEDFRGFLVANHVDLSTSDPNARDWRETLERISTLMEDWLAANPDREETEASRRRVATLRSALDNWPAPDA